MSFGKKSTGSQWLIYWERNMERLPLKACLCVCFFFFFSFSFFNGMDYGVYLWWFIEYMMLPKTFFSLLKSGKRFSFPFYWLAFSTIPNVRKRFSFEQTNPLNAIYFLHNDGIKSKVLVEDLLIALGHGEEEEAKKGHAGAF